MSAFNMIYRAFNAGEYTMKAPVSGTIVAVHFDIVVNGGSNPTSLFNFVAYGDPGDGLSAMEHPQVIAMVLNDTNTTVDHTLMKSVTGLKFPLKFGQDVHFYMGTAGIIQVVVG